MASLYLRPAGRHGGVYWTKYYHPVSFVCLRDSLGTPDRSQAELILRRLELEIELARPEIASAQIPPAILARLGLPRRGGEAAPDDPAPVAVPAIISAPGAPQSPPAADDSALIEGLRRYHAFIAQENDPHHVQGKLSILRAFFGTAVVEQATGAACRNKVKGFYHGAGLNGIIS